jgi:hypothetical protein
MAKLIGGTVTAAVPADNLYNLLVAAGLITAARNDPMFIMNLTVRNASGSDLYVGGADLDQAGTPATVMLTLIDGASLAEILHGYHVNLRDVYIEGSGSVEVLGLQ